MVTETMHGKPQTHGQTGRHIDRRIIYGIGGAAAVGTLYVLSRKEGPRNKLGEAIHTTTEKAGPISKRAGHAIAPISTDKIPFPSIASRALHAAGEVFHIKSNGSEMQEKAMPVAPIETSQAEAQM